MNVLPDNYRALTLSSGIQVAARRTPSKIALREGHRELTYAQLSDRITALARKLIESGMTRGDRVAILAPNCLEYPELVCGIADAGLIAVTLNPRAHAVEISEVLSDSRARCLLVHPSQTALAAASSHPHVELQIVIDADYAAWCASSHGATVLPDISEFDSFVLVYTSGTTGKPKGVLLPHRARTLLFYAKAMEYNCYGRDDRHLAIAPLSSGGGFGFSMGALFFGGFLEILPKFDPLVVLEKLATGGFTGTFVVPSHLHAMLESDPAVLERLRGAAGALKTIICNAAALPFVLKRKAIDYWGAGILHETYGFTEAAIVTNLRPADQLTKPGSVGGGFPLCDVRLLDEAGTDVAPGAVGELYVSSPYLFNGYWERPEDTAACMHDRWISAGDLARQDTDGCYYIVDRKKDMVISGGFNVYPREIEEVLLNHPAIFECAVIGLPDPRWGERLRACLVFKAGARASSEEIQAFCRASLADYKVPRDIVTVDELPRNANGKVLKRILRESYIEASHV